MNRIYKAFFNRNKNCCVVTSEISACFGKERSSRLVYALLLLCLFGFNQSAVAVSADGFQQGGIYSTSAGQSIIDLNQYGSKTDGSSGAVIGKGSIGAGEGSVSFGSGNYWDALGDLSEPKYFINSVRIDRGSGAYEGYHWLRGEYQLVTKDPVTGNIQISTQTFDKHICTSYWGTPNESCSEEIINAANRTLTPEEQLSFFEMVDVKTDQPSYGVQEFTNIKTRKLVNVANGEVSENSTEAINGSQLYELQQQIATGGSEYLSVNASDEEASPSTSAKAIGARSTAVGEEATAKTTQSLAVGYKASAEAASSIALGANSRVSNTDVQASETSGVVSVGSSDPSSGFQRRIINVADGVNSSDAATVGQVGSISRSNIKNSLENILGVAVTDNGVSMTAGDIGQTGQTTVSGAISSVKSSVDNKLDLDFGNLSEDGRDEIAQIAKGSVKVKAGNHVTASSESDGYTVNVVSDGTVKGSKDDHLVTGATVASAIDTETRVSTDGNFIKSNVSAAQNLTALDSEIKENETAIAANTVAIGTKANNDATGIDLSVWQNTLGNGKAEEGNTGLVTGGTLFDSLASKADLNLGNLSEEGLKTITSVAQTSLKVVDGTNTTVRAGKDGEAVTYAVDVIADGTINGNKDSGIVTGSTVASAISGAFNSISTSGSEYQTIIRDQARQSVTVTSSDSDILSVTAVQDEINHTTQYTVGVNVADSIAENDVKPVSGGAVFTEFGRFANAETLTDSNVKAWQQVLGNGEVKKSNTGLVTGGTVYDAISETFGNLDGTTQGDAVKDQAQQAISVKAAEGNQYLSVTKTSDDQTNTDTYSIGLTMADRIGGVAEGLVSSSMVFNEVRPVKDGSVVRRDATTGDNLTALDTNLSTLGTNFGSLSTTVTNLQSLQGLTLAGETKIKNLASNSFTIVGGQHIAAEKTTSDDLVSWTLNVDDSGTISEDSDKLVTGQTVYNYVKDFTTGAGFATISGDNIEVDSWISVLGTPKDISPVSTGNNRFITGSELFNEVHISTDGEYVKGQNTVAGNLTSLDAQLGLVSRNVFDSQGNLALATRSLDNLSSNGIERLKSSVGVVGDGEFLAISKSDTQDGNTRNYALSLKTTESAADGENALVTSDTLGEALKNQNTSITEDLSTKADIDAGNLSDANIQQWQAKLGNGAVVEGNAGLVTGGALFSEVRPAEDGTYVSSTQTTATNLTNLDQGLARLDQNKANVNADNIANYKGEWITALGGSIANDQTGLGFVTGNAIYQWGTPESRVEPYYAISSGYTVGQNLVALDDKLSEIQQSIPTNALDTSLSNLTETGKGTIANIAYGSLNISGSGLITVAKENGGFTIGGVSAGEIAQNSSGLVTGDQVWDALQGISISEDAIQEAINNALTNNDIFQDAVSEAVINNSNVQVAINNALQSEQTLNNIAQNMKPVGQVASDDERAVSGQNVYNYLHSESLGLGAGSTATGTNAFVYGNGSTVSGNNAGGFGSGSTVAANNAYAFGNNNKIASGADNSFAIGNNNTINENASNTFILGSNVTTSAQNAVVLGAGSVGVSNAVSVGSDTVKRKVVNVAPGDVYAGSTDAVNGGQLYDTQQAIVQNSRSIREVAHTLKKDINRAAANAAAMAALQPLGLDEDHKWSAAAGVGHYSGEQALAVGMFYKPTENVMVNFGGSAATGGDAMVNAGIAYRFGAPASYDSMSTSALKSKVVALSDHNRSLEMQLRSAQLREQSMAERVTQSQKELEDLKREVELMKKALGLQLKAVKTNQKSN
ncbi:YadA-like family protein [Parasutterella secunda]|uniref:YadA-like family protein n=1 Tax=Parasutterella secunda TaxID=626947 RepID=A0ABS2GUB8_9BURK|nr:YadA-like family protein [Parasutterella secunda]MBM6929408.1 YadA-like family protein [Parasutterella secunda]